MSIGVRPSIFVNTLKHIILYTITNIAEISERHERIRSTREDIRDATIFAAMTRIDDDSITER